MTFDPDTPVAGFYRTKLRRGGMFVGVRIWWGLPLEPWTREEMDRAPGWQVEVNGRDIPMERVWPACAADPISAQEYAYLSSLQAWGEEHAPDSGVADPTSPADPLTTPMMF